MAATSCINMFPCEFGTNGPGPHFINGLSRILPKAPYCTLYLYAALPLTTQAARTGGLFHHILWLQQLTLALSYINLESILTTVEEDIREYRREVTNNPRHLVFAIVCLPWDTFPTYNVLLLFLYIIHFLGGGSSLSHPHEKATLDSLEKMLAERDNFETISGDNENLPCSRRQGARMSWCHRTE